MTDKEYIEYAKAIHEEAYAMSTPMIDGMAGKVLTRLRKEQPKLLPLKSEWTRTQSNVIDIVDVMSVLAHKGKAWTDMHQDLETILEQYILDRFNELEPKQHFILKYRYIGDFGLVEEVTKRIYERVEEHYDTQRMQNMLQRYPDSNEIQ